MATNDQLQSQIDSITTWINSVISASKLPSELDPSATLTDEKVIIQKDLLDAKNVDPSLFYLKIYDNIYQTEAEILALDPTLFVGQVLWAFDTKSAFVTANDPILLTPNTKWQATTLKYDKATDTFFLPSTQDDQTQNIGQEIFFLAKSEEAVAISSALNPQVYLSGSAVVGDEDYNNAILVNASDIPDGSKYGLNTTDATPGRKFKCTTYGRLNGVDTSPWLLDDVLYVDPVIKGGMTNIRPLIAYPIAIVKKAHVTDGILEVNSVQNTQLDRTTSLATSSLTYLTGQEITPVATIFYEALLEDKGIVATANEQVTVSSNTTVGLSQNHLSEPILADTIIIAGERKATLSYSVSSINANEEFFIETYLTDSNGVIIDSGTGLPNGTLGFPPIFNMQSPVLNTVVINQEFTAELIGSLSADFGFLAGQRYLTHILCRKEGTGGQDVIFTVYFGSNHDSKIIGVLKITTDNVQNTSNVTGETATEALNSLDVRVQRKMEWHNRWLQTDYLQWQTVKDGVYTMIANQDTSARPAPEKLGNPIYLVPDIPIWSGLNNTVQVYTGLQATVPVGKIFQIIAYRFWSVSTAASYTYRIWIVSPDGIGGVVFNTINILAGDKTILGWNTFNYPSDLFVDGIVFQVILQTLNSSTGITVAGGWNRNSNSNNAPANQGWLVNNSTTVLRIDKTDLNAVDRTVELLSIVSGSTIQFTETGEPLRSVTFSVLSDPTDTGTDVTYNISEISQGSFGYPAVGVVTTMSAEVPTPATTEYVELTDGFLGSTDIIGLKSLTGSYADIVSNTNAYGIDIELQEYSVSEDWDLVAVSSGAAAGGGDVTGLQAVVDDTTPELGGQLDALNNNIVNVGDITANRFIIPAGVTTHFLKANGDVDTTQYLPLTGGTISGSILLGAPPTTGSHLTNKTYVDSLVPDLSGFVPYTGATTNLDLGAHNLYASNIGVGTITPAHTISAYNPNNHTWIQSLALAGNQSGFVLQSPSITWVLRQNGSASGEKFQIRNSTADRQDLTIDTSGNVGVGIEIPTKKFHVVGEGLFTGNVSSNPAPTLGDHLVNLTYLQANTAPNADYLRADVADTKSSGDLTFLGSVNINFNSKSLLFGYSSATAWNLLSGDLFIQDTGVTRFTFGRTTGDFTATGDVTAETYIYSHGGIYYGRVDGANKSALRVNDAWLRINPDGHFTSGIYVPSTNPVVRFDTVLQTNSSSATGLYANYTLDVFNWIGSPILTVNNFDSEVGGNFLKSNASDRYTSGTLGLDTGTVFAFGTNNEVDISVQGSNLVWDLNAVDWVIRDTATTRYTLHRTTGNLTLHTGIITSSGTGNNSFGGNVGIGTTNPVSVLHTYENNTSTIGGITIEQAGTGDAVLQYLISGVRRWVVGVDNSDSDKYKIATSSDLISDARLTIDVLGNVGIGTTAPTRLLHLTGSGAVDMSTPNGYGGILMQTTQGGGMDIFAGDQTANPVWNFRTFGGEQIAFSPNSTETMRLDASGNVGIGTTVPATRLSSSSTAISDGSQSVGSNGFNWSGANGNAYMGAIHNTSTGNGLLIKVGDSSSARKVIYAQDGSNNPLFLVRGDGNVGIGTTTPTNLLHVNSESTKAGIMISGYDGGTQDSFVTFGDSAGSQWTIGIDATNFHRFVISHSDTLGTSDALEITDGGDIINPAGTNPIDDDQLVTKKYVDDTVGGGAGNVFGAFILTDGTINSVIFSDGATWAVTRPSTGLYEVTRNGVAIGNGNSIQTVMISAGVISAAFAISVGTTNYQFIKVGGGNVDYSHTLMVTMIP